MSYQFQEKNHFFYELGQVLSCIGLIFYEKKNYSTALQYFNKSVKVYQDNNDDLRGMKVLQNIALTYYHQGQNLKALEQLELLFSLYQVIISKQCLQILDPYSKMGLIFCSMGQYEKSIQYYRRGMQICVKIQGPKSLNTAQFLVYIGQVEYQRQNNNKALQMFEKALVIYEQHKRKQSIKLAIILQKLCLVYLSIGQFQQAHQCYQKSTNICKMKKNQYLLSFAHIISQVGQKYYDLGNFLKALDLFKQIIILIQQKQPKSPVYHKTLFCIGLVYSQNLEQYESAIIPLEKSLILCYQVDIDQIKNIASLLVKCYSKLDKVERMNELIEFYDLDPQ